MQTVRISDDIHWLSQCIDVGEGRHMHLSQYLMCTEEANILIDAGTGHEKEIKAAIEENTGGEGVDAIVLTHHILPHSGNLEHFHEVWPEANMYSPQVKPELMGLPSETEFNMATTSKTIGGQEFSFLNPLLTDVAMTNWIHNTERNVMFTAEGVGNFHRPGECERMYGELPPGKRYQYVHRFNHDKLPPLGFIDTEKIQTAFDTVLEQYETDHIAPAHGNPIGKPDIDDYLNHLTRSIRESDPIPGGV